MYNHYERCTSYDDKYRSYFDIHVHIARHIVEMIRVSVSDPGILEPGEGDPNAVKFFRSRDCLDAPLHLPYAFVYNTRCKHCMLITIKVMRDLQSKFLEINP